MDAVHLNKINELAREYLRLGIARNTTDAVEKARFQLSFEQNNKQKSIEDNAFESFFEKMKEEKAENKTENLLENEENLNEINKDILGIKPKKSKYEKKLILFEKTLKNLEDQYVQIIDSQNSKIALLESEISNLKQEIKLLKQQNFTREEQQSHQRKLSETPKENEKKGISKTIEQTIKGRKITAEEVAVDKIFYFGNK